MNKPAYDLVMNYKHFLNGFIHKHLPHNEIGQNSLHDEISFYSISNLIGGELAQSGKLHFHNEVSFFMNFLDPALGKAFTQNVIAAPEVFADMKITDITIQETPDFPDFMRFSVASPVLVKKFDGKTIRHLRYDDPAASDVMTATMQTKLRAAGLEQFADTVRVRFDTNYAGAKTKLVDIHGIKNRANACPVIVEGSPEAVAFAWDVGVGHSTGAGFGALR